jgi:hypothetical protein
MSSNINQTWVADHVVLTPINNLKAHAQNNRIHNAASIDKLKVSIATFGFVIPVLAAADGTIIAGHGRVEAAKTLGIANIPVVVVDHLSAAQVRALRIADNKLAELSDWNEAALHIELGELMDLSLDGALDFSLDITGLDAAEINIIILGDSDPAPSETLPPAEPDTPPVTQQGDLWQLGVHRIFCGDALNAESFDTLLGEEIPSMVFADPP